MRVLMTTDSQGGVWDHSVTLAAAMQARGHEVVLAHVGPPLPPEQAAVAASRRVRVVTGPFPLEWQPEGLAAAAACRQWLSGLVRSQQADMLHCNGYSHVLPDAPVPQVLAAHSSLHGWWESVQDGAPPPHWEPYRAVVRKALRHADAVVAPTAAMLDELQRHYDPAATAAAPRRGNRPPDARDDGRARRGRNGHLDGHRPRGSDDRGDGTTAHPRHWRVIPNGIDLPAATAAREPFVLAGGRLWDRGKGHHVLDAAAAGLPWRVAATGPGGEDRALPNLDLAGFLPRHGVDRLMASAGLYANPALYETFGLGALEAAARGCPLILSDLPSHREIWGDAAAYAPPGDAAAWHHALRRLVTAPEERDRLAARSLARARSLDAATMARAYEDIAVAAVEVVAA